MTPNPCLTAPPGVRRRRATLALLAAFVLPGCACTASSPARESLHELVDKYAPSALEWSLLPHRAELAVPDKTGPVAPPRTQRVSDAGACRDAGVEACVFTFG